MGKLYSLWVTPSSELKRNLDRIINQLANKYKSPKFEAHMTLLGDVDAQEKVVIQKTRKLAKLVKPFTLHLSEISFSTTYFQSVFVRIKSTGALMEANLKAKEIFNFKNNLFMPHMSLIYGEQPMKLREKISSGINLPKNQYFEAKRIIVVPSTPNPDEWYRVAEISLHP